MKLVNRRDFLKVLGLGGAGAAAAACAGQVRTQESGDVVGGVLNEPQFSDASRIQHAQILQTNGERSIFPPFPGPAGEPGQLDSLLYPPPPEPASPGRVREYTLVAQNRTIEVAKDTFFEAWTYNGTVPGPIIRATVGDILRVRFRNEGTHPHTIHFHGIHPAKMDGVFETVGPGGEFVYEFEAEPFGVFPYHCHANPLDQHVARGLYGAMIIDPPEPRPPAKELVMVMNGYDLNLDGENEIYSVNGIGMYYGRYPIQLKVNELVRIYVVNMTEFDPVNSLHIHANMFQLYRSGTSLTPHELTDIVTLGVGERAILEFTYKYPGRFMFHAHQTEIALLGWMGFFDVVEEGATTANTPVQGDPQLTEYLSLVCRLPQTASG
jgi:FtsP/CotA-like multicopper oxidase with cupredoxin domain